MKINYETITSVTPDAHLDIQFSIQSEQTSKLFKLLSDRIYTSPYRAIPELIANAKDADPHNPPTIKKPLVFEADPVFRITDRGPGMTREFMTTTYTNPLVSTKRHSDQLIGGFGVGRLSALQFNRSYKIFTKPSDGSIATNALIYLDDYETPRIKLLPLPPNWQELPHGTTVEFSLSDKIDPTQFCDYVDLYMTLFYPDHSPLLKISDHLYIGCLPFTNPTPPMDIYMFVEYKGYPYPSNHMYDVKYHMNNFLPANCKMLGSNKLHLLLRIPGEGQYSLPNLHIPVSREKVDFPHGTLASLLKFEISSNFDRFMKTLKPFCTEIYPVSVMKWDSKSSKFMKSYLVEVKKDHIIYTKDYMSSIPKNLSNKAILVELSDVPEMEKFGYSVTSSIKNLDMETDVTFQYYSNGVYHAIVKSLSFFRKITHRFLYHPIDKVARLYSIDHPNEIVYVYNFDNFNKAVRVEATKISFPELVHALCYNKLEHIYSHTIKLELLEEMQLPYFYAKTGLESYIHAFKLEEFVKKLGKVIDTYKEQLVASNKWMRYTHCLPDHLYTDQYLKIVYPEKTLMEFIRDKHPKLVEEYENARCR